MLARAPLRPLPSALTSARDWWEAHATRVANPCDVGAGHWPCSPNDRNTPSTRHSLAPYGRCSNVLVSSRLVTDCVGFVRVQKARSARGPCVGSGGSPPSGWLPPGPPTLGPLWGLGHRTASSLLPSFTALRGHTTWPFVKTEGLMWGLGCLAVSLPIFAQDRQRTVDCDPPSAPFNQLFQAQRQALVGSARDSRCEPMRRWGRALALLPK